MVRHPDRGFKTCNGGEMKELQATDPDKKQSINTSNFLKPFDYEKSYHYPHPSGFHYPC